MLQNSVTAKQGFGTAGYVAQAQNSYFNIIQAFCEDDSVKIGSFVQRGSADGFVKGADSGAEVLGLAIFGVMKSADNVTSECERGDVVGVLNIGNAYIEVNQKCSSGDYVCVDSRGAVVIDSAVPSGAIFTGFRVVVGHDSTERGVIEITTANTAGSGGGTSSGGSVNLTNYYKKAEVDAKLGEISQAVNSTGQTLNANMTALTQNTNAIKTQLLDADTAMQNDISGINAKIPSEASATNQLASQEYVKEQVATAAARAISADADGNGFDSHAALTAGKWYSLGVETTPKKNDYAVVKKDATHNGNDVRYNFDGAVWVFFQEFTNGAGFTPSTAQSLAMDSGATAEKIAQIETNKGDITALNSALTAQVADLKVLIQAETNARDQADNNVLVKLESETAARTASEGTLSDRITALETGSNFWYFNMPAQTLILSSQTDKAIDGISTNIPVSDIEFEYEESGKSTIIPSDTEAWKIHFVTGSSNAKYALCKQISTGAYIGKFYLNTSHGGSSSTAEINFITYKRTN